MKLLVPSLVPFSASLADVEVAPHDPADGLPLGASELLGDVLQAHVQGSPLRDLVTPLRKARS